MKMRRLFSLTIATMISSLPALAQQTCFQNPSVEGPSAPHIVPAPWTNCYGSPDTQPGQWGIVQAPSNGNSYISFLHDGASANGYTEGMGQGPVSGVLANTAYTFTVDLAHSNVYNTAGPGTCYSSVQFWGGSASCQRGELLWQSGSFMHTNWQTYIVTFTPSTNWTYFTFEPYFITPCTGYINAMLDNISCIAPMNGTVISGTNVTCSDICDGSASAFPFFGTPPYTYLWTPGNMTTSTITGLCAGTYTCVVTDSAAQTTIGSYTVVAPASMTITPIVTNDICSGYCDGSASPFITGGMPPYSFLWSPGGMTTQSVSELCAGTYTITVTDTNGCSVIDSMMITTPPPFTASTSGTGVSCPGANDGTALVIASGGVGPYTYQWFPSGGTQASASNLGPGSYAILITDFNGCQFVANVTIPENVPVVSVSPDVTIITGDNTTLTATGVGTFAWSPATGLSCTTCSTVTASPTVTTQYCVTLTDSMGCLDTACVLVTVENPCGMNSSLGAPNAFSPNNDGHNDLFLIPETDFCFEVYSLSVYNRWGEKVFQTSVPNTAWDGTFMGKKLDPDVYMYYIYKTYAANNMAVINKGNVSLIR